MDGVTISKLIEVLEEVQESRGDLDVVFTVDDTPALLMMSACYYEDDEGEEQQVVQIDLHVGETH